MDNKMEIVLELRTSGVGGIRGLRSLGVLDHTCLGVLSPA